MLSLKTALADDQSTMTPRGPTGEGNEDLLDAGASWGDDADEEEEDGIGRGVEISMEVASSPAMPALVLRASIKTHTKPGSKRRS